MPSFAVPARPAGFTAVTGGLAVIGLGIAAAIEPDSAGATWFVIAGVAAGLLVAAVLGLRNVVDGVRAARIALSVTAPALALFGIAHFYALVDEDTAILLFSVFMVVASLGLIVAGVAIIRADVWHGARRFLPLLCGLWPVATIPAGAAIGDLPHFLAVACWGACWTALGLALLAVPAPRRRAAHQPI